jgi:hypothetical protein
LDQTEGRSADVPWRLIYIWICSGSAQCHRHRGFLTLQQIHSTESPSKVTCIGGYRQCDPNALSVGVRRRMSTTPSSELYCFYGERCVIRIMWYAGTVN